RRTRSRARRPPAPAPGPGSFPESRRPETRALHRSPQGRKGRRSPSALARRRPFRPRSSLPPPAPARPVPRQETPTFACSSSRSLLQCGKTDLCPQGRKARIRANRGVLGPAIHLHQAPRPILESAVEEREGFVATAESAVHRTDERRVDVAVSGF